MSITFTPVPPIVYVTFSAAGHANIGSKNSYIEFRIVNVTAGNAVVAETNSMITDTDRNSIATSWNSSINMFPVVVTPGTPTT